MGLKKGMTNNPHGRPRGRANKATALHRAFIQDLLNSQMGKIKVELQGLKGKDYINAIIALAEFVIPKAQKGGLADEPEIHIRIGHSEPIGGGYHDASDE